MRALWAMPLIGAILGTFTILFTLAGGGAAPGQAAGYAMACALAIVPYVFTRAVIGLGDATRNQSTERIVAAIKGAGPNSDASPKYAEPAGQQRVFTR